MNAEIGSILVYCAWNCADGGMSSPSSVEDKHKVANLTFIPKFLPEITIGAHEYDESYYKFKSVCMARCGTGGDRWHLVHRDLPTGILHGSYCRLRVTRLPLQRWYLQSPKPFSIAFSSPINKLVCSFIFLSPRPLWARLSVIRGHTAFHRDESHFPATFKRRIGFRAHETANATQRNIPPGSWASSVLQENIWVWPFLFIQWNLVVCAPPPPQTPLHPLQQTWGCVTVIRGTLTWHFLHRNGGENAERLLWGTHDVRGHFGFEVLWVQLLYW